MRTSLQAYAIKLTRTMIYKIQLKDGLDASEKQKQLKVSRRSIALCHLAYLIWDKNVTSEEPIA